DRVERRGERRIGAAPLERRARLRRSGGVGAPRERLPEETEAHDEENDRAGRQRERELALAVDAAELEGAIARGTARAGLDQLRREVEPRGASELRGDRLGALDRLREVARGGERADEEELEVRRAPVAEGLLEDLLGAVLEPEVEVDLPELLG